MSKIEEILLNRVKFIGENEWTLLGCPDDVIKELEQIEKEARLDGLMMARYVTAKNSREEKAIDVLIKSQELEKE